MELTINPKDVAPLLRKVERVIAAKSTIPALENFLIRCNDDKLTVTAFDGEVRATATVPMLSSDCNFDFCVNARKFSQAINAIKTDVAKVVLDGNATMMCTHKKGKFNLSYTNGTDYPTAQQQGDVVYKHIEMKYVSSIINDVSYAAGTDTLRPIMMGVYFDFTDGGVIGVATDTMMLVKSTINIDDLSEMQPFVMPIKAASIVSSFIDQSSMDDKLVVSNDGKVVDIVLDGKWSISFRQIEGRYPKYNAVIPQKTDNNVFVKRVELIDSLQRALLFSSTQNNAVRIGFQHDKLELVAQDIDYNMSAKEEIECNYGGADMTIGFNGSSLLDILGHFTEEDIVFNITDAQRAVMIFPSNSNVLAIVMPMMI